MTLLELCEPLFQYVCKLNRVARKGGMVDAAEARAQIKAIFADLKAKADSTQGVGPQYERVELPLIFFADFMVRECGLSWASGWKNLAYDRREMAGDEKFFELLEETLVESGESANHRLAIFYTCIGLGFPGLYTGQPEALRRKMNELAVRLRGMIDTDQVGRICPEAYENIDTRMLTQPPARSLMGLGIAAALMVVVVLATYFVLFRQNSKKLIDALNNVDQGPVAGATQPKP
jgi:hypothetical protein